MRAMITRFVKDDAGQDLIEYALLAAFIALACVVAMGLVGTGVNDLFTSIKDKLQAAAK
jgi:pilus assembly protein Flp/PilA